MTKKISYLLLLSFLLWFMGFALFAWQINNFAPDTQTKTDAIIALTGGKNRITEAVKILN
ncbi:MAG: hypothetical protein J6V11_02335 [Alphaproteobacteria bacterium]|nr:hypothetical protein [Alphaproteobacteria bacterium]